VECNTRVDRSGSGKAGWRRRGRGSICRVPAESQSLSGTWCMSRLSTYSGITKCIIFHSCPHGHFPPRMPSEKYHFLLPSTLRTHLTGTFEFHTHHFDAFPNLSAQDAHLVLPALPPLQSPRRTFRNLDVMASNSSLKAAGLGLTGAPGAPR
jgi:hypothetical protein